MLTIIYCFVYWAICMSTVLSANFNLPSNVKDENEWRPIIPNTKQNLLKKNDYYHQGNSDVATSYNKLEFRYKPIDNAKVNHHGSTGFNMIIPKQNATSFNENYSKDFNSNNHNYAHRNPTNKQSQYQYYPKLNYEHNKNVKQPLPASSNKQENFASLTPFYHGPSQPLFDQNKFNVNFMKNYPHASYVHVDHVVPYTTVTSHDYEYKNHNYKQNFVNNKAAASINHQYYPPSGFYENDYTRNFIPIKSTKLRSPVSSNFPSSAPTGQSAPAQSIKDTNRKIQMKKIIPENILVQLPPPVLKSQHNSQYNFNKNKVAVLSNGYGHGHGQKNQELLDALGYEVTEQNWKDDNLHYISNPFNYNYKNNKNPSASVFLPTPNSDTHSYKFNENIFSSTPKVYFGVTESPTSNFIELSTYPNSNDRFPQNQENEINLFKYHISTESSVIDKENNKDIRGTKSTKTNAKKSERLSTTPYSISTSGSVTHKPYLKAKIGSRKRKPFTSTTTTPSTADTHSYTLPTTLKTIIKDSNFGNHYTNQESITELSFSTESNDLKKVTERLQESYEYPSSEATSSSSVSFKKRKQNINSSISTISTSTTTDPEIKTEISSGQYSMSSIRNYETSPIVYDIESNTNEIAAEVTNSQNKNNNLESSLNQEEATSSENYPPIHIINKIKAQRKELSTSTSHPQFTTIVVSSAFPNTEESLQSLSTTKKPRTRPRFSVKDFRKKQTSENSTFSTTVSSPPTTIANSRRKSYLKRTKQTTTAITANEKNSQSETATEKPKGRISTKRRYSSSLSTTTSIPNYPQRASTENQPISFKGTDRTNMLNNVKKGTLVRIKQRILKKNKNSTTTKPLEHTNKKPENDDLSSDTSDHYYSTIKHFELLEKNDKNFDIEDKIDNEENIESNFNEADDETKQNTENDEAFDMDAYIQSQMVSNLTLASPYSPNRNKVLLQSRKVPQHFTLATDHPILPIEAFFPKIFQNKLN